MSGIYFVDIHLGGPSSPPVSAIVDLGAGTMPSMLPCDVIHAALPLSENASSVRIQLMSSLEQMQASPWSTGWRPVRWA